MTETTASPPPTASVRQTGGRAVVWFFAALGVLTALAVIWLAVVVTSDFRRREPAEVAARDRSETYVVGSVTPVVGTAFIAIEIAAMQKGGGIKSSGYQDDLRNVLLLDRTSGKSRKILPDNRIRIAEIDYYPAAAQADGPEYVAKAADESKTPLAYYVLQLEHRREGRTSVDLLIGLLASGEQRVVLQGLDGVEQARMLDNRRLGLVVRQGKALSYRIVDMVDRKVLESHPIAID